MSISQSMLPEFDHEMASTRKVLERIPDDKLNWKAHEKSNTMGWVGAHLANIPFWAVMTLTKGELDIHPVGGEPFRTTLCNSTKEILDNFDKNVAAARAAIVAAPDSEFFKPWSLLKSGQKLFTIPKVAVLRSMVMNHIIHHRAHMCVYLRLNNIPVPGLYGPSADDAGM